MALAIRRDVRRTRTDRGRGGHRFNFNYLKTVWGANDAAHAVLNHIDDLAWQIWYRDPAQGWLMVSWHMTRREAQAAAETTAFTQRQKVVDPDPGLYVLAGPTLGRLTIRTHCSCEYTAEQLEDTYTRLGFVTQRETIAAPVL